MILCFSGTGNSRAVADILAECTGDSVLKMGHDVPEVLALAPGEGLGIVFPVYGWGLPKAVETYVRRMVLEYEATPYIYIVCTCGDDIGRTDRLAAKELNRKGLSLDAAWSVFMPNTYTALPGFDVDSKQLEQQKLAAVKARVEEIAGAVNGRKSGVVDVHPGAFAALKSYILRPLFNRFCVNDAFLKHDERCNGCGKCVSVCPVGNIRMDGNGRPEWLGHCTGCLGCYHFCPRKSIAYGRFSRGKGRYRCPIKPGKTLR